MKKKSFIKFVALLLVCCAMLGCGKENVHPTPMSTRVYGTVFDLNTGEPLPRVYVGLAKYIEDFDDYTVVSTTYSGSDGQYEFVLDDVSGQELYDIGAGCDGYNIFEMEFLLNEGSSKKIEILLKPLEKQ